MRSIIEELYYGNISPTDRDIIIGGTYSHILNLDSFLRDFYHKKNQKYSIVQ